MRWIVSLLLILAGLAVAGSAQGACASRALISGYNSDNVHVYDACTGSFEFVLDTTHLIGGPQALREANGLLYVTSEKNGRVLRYNARTLAFKDILIQTGAGFNPTGVAIGPDGDVYVCGYEADSVRRYDGGTGVLEATVVAPRAAGLNGPDNGMTFGPDGRLYIPGYLSNSVVVYDPATGQTSGFIANGSGGLNHTRGILFEPGGTVLVSSEGTGKILRYSASGAFIGTFAQNLGGPAGMSFYPDGSVLVATNDSSAAKLSPTGEFILSLVPGNGTGGLLGATFAAVIANESAVVVNPALLGSQYWVVGSAVIQGRVLDITGTVSATGAAFGPAFRPQDVTVRPWGRLRLEFTSCTSANFSWDSTAPDSAGFGSGSYPLSIFIPTVLTAPCVATPFDQVTNTDWINGTWWGGPDRNGEGILITKAPDGTVFLAWFTYRPPTL